jgi:phospholipase C
MGDLDKIKTIVVVMMENRSFDHLLGYRSLPPLNADVDGHSADPQWKSQVANVDIDGTKTAPFQNTNPYSLPPGFDPPHQRSDVESILAR